MATPAAVLASHLLGLQNKLRQKSGQLDSATDNAGSQQREADEMIRQIELDADQEILRLKLRYEKQLQEERETSGRLKVCCTQAILWFKALLIESW